MKPSKFNVFIPLQDSDGYIIFNTFTDSRVVVERKLKEKIEMSPVNEFLFCERERTYLKELLELGFLVNDDVDEDLELQYWFQRLKFDSSILDITVLTTYAGRRFYGLSGNWNMSGHALLDSHSLEESHC